MIRRKIFFESVAQKYNRALVPAFIITIVMVSIAFFAFSNQSAIQEQLTTFASADVVQEAEARSIASEGDTASSITCVKGGLPNRTLTPDEVCGEPGPDVRPTLGLG
ncbi:hypothetical protein NTE_01357 [Candidatus Nitrososphaera evergladensis SR1]|uniref:Uncharacterized protein n=1 Tax=Candidatus Nitrososphaera evergladensis SR1 TaxID=1459636 RepID=A0A075MQQ9_9ARCH|nr:hypothetical protein [Candidatus Nitrososphaera evergladensis]AIF83425.1 hypothetical protein NTE_01357 [Candidatus Nitrososphaera evergladensis SR1]